MKSSPSGRVVAEYRCTYRWLLEVLEHPDKLIARYAGKAMEGVTDNAWLAHWFATKGEAESFIEKAPKLPEGAAWAAIEHGFCEG